MIRKWVDKYNAENGMLEKETYSERLQGVMVLSRLADVPDRRVRLLLEGKRQDWVSFSFADRVITKGFGNPFLWYQDPLREWYLEKLDLRTNEEIFTPNRVAVIEREKARGRRRRLEARAA